MRLTAEQTRAVRQDGENILVAAAAGSGKTGVLTQRVLRHVQEGTPVDDLLILTFTRAAAGEMRRRIREALFAALQAADGEQRQALRHQLTLLSAAPITTIHAFCMQLLRSHYQAIPDLDPKFRIFDPQQAAIRRGDLLRDFMEGCYAHPDPARRAAFCDLVRVYGSGLSDEGLRSEILRLIDFGSARGDLAEWLHGSLARFADFDLWHTLAIEDGREKLDLLSKELQTLYDDNVRLRGPGGYGETLTEDMVALATLREADWDALGSAKPFGRLRSKHKDDNAEVADFIKDRRTGIKKYFEDKLQPLFRRPFRAYAEELAATLPRMEALVAVTLEFYELYRAYKLKKGYLEFGDLELLTLQLLRENPALAAEYRHRFREVLVDEYQDINPLQDAIIGLLARPDDLFVVGDVKQSIYGFRFADHTLFQRRAESYEQEEGRGCCIRLNQNFRSRADILNGANFFFSQWLDKAACGLDYGEDEALRPGAQYHARAENSMELLFVAPDADDESASACEGRCIAARIEELMEEGFPVGRTGKERPLRYDDVAILLRSPHTTAGGIIEALQARGIPVVRPEDEGFLSGQEVRVLLALLAVIDNPRRDIELCAVLRSPLFGFDEDELLAVSTRPKNTRIWPRLRDGSVEGVDAAKVAAVVAAIERWRGLAKCYAAGDLLRLLLAETDHAAFWGGLPDGRRRLARIRALQQRADSFQAEEAGGLFDFLRYLESLRAGGGDRLESAEANAGCVSVLSIHKSKGLEFPVVFVAGLKRKFNRRTLSEPLVLHGELGFGPKCTDLTRRTVAPTLPRLLIRDRLERADFAEDLRVLYVAMTRAAEKLCLVTAATEEDVQKAVARAAHCAAPKLPADLMMRSSNYFQWLCYGLARHGDAALPYGDAPFLIDYPDNDAVTAVAAAAAVQPPLTPQAFARLRQALAAQAAPPLPAKISVTDVLRGEAEEEPEPPVFLPAGRLTAAQRGTAFHRLLEQIPLDRIWDAAALDAYIDSLRSAGTIAAPLLDAIDRDAVLAFLNSTYGEELRHARTVRRELPFTASFAARELLPTDSEERVILQGAVDLLCCTADGRWLLLDYKTGRAGDDAQFLARYAGQLELYAQALQKLYRIEIAEKVFYQSATRRFLRA